MIITTMSRPECLALLGSKRIGRLACAKDNQPYLVPITFALHDDHLYGCSLEGQKVEWMRANPKVCVQVDAFDQLTEWQSVVVHGIFEELPDRVGHKIERERAWSIVSKDAGWWQPGTSKPAGATPAAELFYRIAIKEISGRRAVPED